MARTASVHLLLPGIAVGLLLWSLAAPRAPAGAVSADVVISQVYGGGGNSGAPFRNDFVELFNRGASPVDLSGWSMQYASAASSTWGSKTNLTGVIQPGRYYLVSEADGSGCAGAPCGSPL